MGQPHFISTLIVQLCAVAQWFSARQSDSGSSEVSCKLNACRTLRFDFLCPSVADFKHVGNGISMICMLEMEEWMCACMYTCVCVCLVYRLLCLKITQKWHETTLTTPNIPQQHSLQIPSRERIHIPPGEEARKSSTQKCQKIGNMLVLLGEYVDVSKNRGTPKWKIYNGKPY